MINVKNLLSGDGLHFILEKTVVNFTDFAPLGIVLVAMLGIGIAESSGLIGVAIRLLVLSAPKSLLTFVLVFAGIMSNMASDIGYMLLIPMAGVIFIGWTILLMAWIYFDIPLGPDSPLYYHGAAHL